MEIIKLLLLLGTIYFSQRVGWHDNICMNDSSKSMKKLVVYTIFNFICVFGLAMLMFLK